TKSVEFSFAKRNLLFQLTVKGIPSFEKVNSTPKRYKAEFSFSIDQDFIHQSPGVGSHMMLPCFTQTPGLLKLKAEICRSGMFCQLTPVNVT
ncbi:MAG TPA: hypothetical protein PK369_09915, partial [Thermoclostridium sp.]|nr:hypothetical protein [Thermoclostridium sp.]HPU45988.1 hypothetical protein [Thermoclostridium sp.]